ncbi:aspartate/tyrosine/aromatic aminotransferase [Bradyrhizobium sp. BRP14]|nr:aspartate/tyrosine/aromatic aminotransferase [Bradyrhizobium sp. BRP14]
MIHGTLLEHLPEQMPDPLLDLIKKFASDSRADKIDLGVGVYRDEHGDTPVMAAVKDAERHIWETQTTKSYVGPEGDPEFIEALAREVFGQRKGSSRLNGVQTPGGTAALRLGAELLAQDSNRQIWIGTPTWPNHYSIFATVGLKNQTYPFFDPQSQTVLVDQMLSALEGANPGDAVLLHSSCHNPTGASLSHEVWGEIATLVSRKGLLPFLDNAYQGLGRGFVEDSKGMMTVLQAAEEAIVAVSCSKSFSLYRERTGAAYVFGRSDADVGRGIGNLAAHARSSYSMPPAHGAAVVAAILNDDARRGLWIDELEVMRRRVVEIRHALAERLSLFRPTLSRIADQEGMFSLLPLTPDSVRELRAEAGIYMPESGRANLAGLRIEQAKNVAEAIGKFL